MMTTWPPVEWLWRQHRRNGAWYSGEEDALRLHTEGFWQSSSRHKFHIPIPADLAALSAGLLFSGSPTLTSADGTTDERLQLLTQEVGLYQLLLQAAELQSAYGGVFLKLNWDVKLVQRPIVAVVPGDQGLPVYRQNILTECRFWTEIYRDDTGAVWRKQETYTNDGMILSTLYKGTSEMLGDVVPMSSRPETDGTPESANSGTGMLLAMYVPNRLPNRTFPWCRYGSSDYEGLYYLFSALDTAYTSLMRDVRLSQMRVIVPMDFLRKKETIKETLDSAPQAEWVYYSADEIYAAMDINPQDSGAGVTTIQPDIRSEKLLGIVDDLTSRVYMMAGFSPQTAGIDINGRAESGTALNVRERRSLQTIEAKKTYWWHALMDFTRAMLALDYSVFHSGANAQADITVSFADNTQPDMQTVADTVQRMSAAGAVSTYTMVKLLHPDWEEADIQEEVDRISEDKAGRATAFAAQFGAGTADGPDGQDAEDGGENAEGAGEGT